MAEPAENANAKLLQLRRYKKQYRGRSGTWEKDFVADFLFAIRPADDPRARPATFWCEVRLHHSLATRGAWKDLSDADRFKALYLFAVDAIRRAGGRPIRQMSLGWMPAQPYAEGPCWDLASVDLRRPPPVRIEGDGIQPVVVHQH